MVKKGEDCIAYAPASWKTYSMLSSIDYNGKTNSIMVEGGVTKDIFKEFMEEIMLSSVKAGDTIILDNCSIHKNSFDIEKFLKKAVQIKYLPRYSPDLNPIEKMWSKIKTYLRKMKCRKFLDLWREVSVAHLNVTSQDAAGWYSCCGYIH